MSGGVLTFLTRRRGGKSWHFTDVLAWIWLASGLLLMFGPVVWLALSSFKTRAALTEFPPTLLPYETRMAAVPGHDEPLPLARNDERGLGPDGHRRVTPLQQIAVGPVGRGLATVEQTGFGQQNCAGTGGGKGRTRVVTPAEPGNFFEEAAVDRLTGRDGQFRHTDDVGAESGLE